jgi:hypothetical protein
MRMDRIAAYVKIEGEGGGGLGWEEDERLYEGLTKPSLHSKQRKGHAIEFLGLTCAIVFCMFCLY